MNATEKAQLESFLHDLAHAAGEVQLRYWRSLKSVEKKGDIDLVTIADKETEVLLVSLIQAKFPGHAVLGEEGGAQGADRSADYRWILDPIDGTTNFAHGLPIFSCSIGLEYRGEMLAGCVYAPAINELYSAIQGHGCWRNGSKVHVSQTETLIDAMVVTGFPYNRAAILPWILANLGKFISGARGVVRFGSAAYDLACIAAGNSDCFYEANLKPWDVAAGSLLVTEAGGRMSDFHGNRFDVYGNQLVATNSLIHPLILEILAEHQHLLPAQEPNRL